MQNGRVASVQEGKFVGNVAPYGFSRKKIKGDKGFILVENPEEADTLKLIFELYANLNYSYNRIADHLNSLGIKPRHAKKIGLWQPFVTFFTTKLIEEFCIGGLERM